MQFSAGRESLVLYLRVQVFKETVRKILSPLVLRKLFSLLLFLFFAFLSLLLLLLWLQNLLRLRIQVSSGTKSKTLSPETSVPCNLQVACCCLMQFSAEKESLVVLENTSLSVKQDSKQNHVAPGVDVVVLIVFAHALTVVFCFSHSCCCCCCGCQSGFTCEYKC